MSAALALSIAKTKPGGFIDLPGLVFALASPMGFEHTAFRLGGGRSIQLSYGDMGLHPWGQNNPQNAVPYYNTATGL